MSSIKEEAKKAWDREVPKSLSRECKIGIHMSQSVLAACACGVLASAAGIVGSVLCENPVGMWVSGMCLGANLLGGAGLVWRSELRDYKFESERGRG